jgi:hypothetical protein
MLHPLLKNVLQTICCKLQEDSGTGAVLGLPLWGSSFNVCFSISKVLPPLENCSLSHCIISIGFMDEL